MKVAAALADDWLAVCERMVERLLTANEIDDIRSDCLADDVLIDVPLMQHWSEDECRTFFESGGICAPPRLLRSVAALLAEADATPLTEALNGVTLEDLMRRFCSRGGGGGRRALQKLLKRRGVGSVGDRQRVANALARAWREGRVAPAAPSLTPLKPPAELWRQCVAAIGQLRSLSSSELATLLGGTLAAETATELAAVHGSDEEAARALRSDRLGDILEELGWQFESASLAGGLCCKPRLGQGLALWTNSMCERGTEVAVYDYADAAERELGMTAWVLYPGGGAEPAR